MNGFMELIKSAIRVNNAPAVAECGCCPDRKYECAKAEELGDDAARKFQSYSAARGTVFEKPAKHTWELARVRYLRHITEARGCLGITG